MGIRKAYNDIKALHDGLSFQTRNNMAVLSMECIGKSMHDALDASCSYAIIEAYGNALDIIERECPEVLKEEQHG